MSNASEEDDVYQSSGEEWNANTEKKRSTSRRTSQRLRKKPRISVGEDSSTDSDNERIHIPQPKKKPPKPPKVLSKRFPFKAGTLILNKDFSTGGFLVLKKDVQLGDASKSPCLWRIDGKALLQKYEAVEDQGKTVHRSTSIYTGWTPLDKDLYSPVNVRVQWHTSQQMTVELDWETLKNATMDSD